MRTILLATLLGIGCMPPNEAALGERPEALSGSNGWTNGSLNGWNNAWANGSLNGYSGSFIGGWANGWANGSLNGFSNGSLNGWSNSWSNGWVNGVTPSSTVQGDGTKWIKNVRVETGRVLADACINPVALGLLSCPADLDGSGQCCRRAMLLKGVYWADTNTNGHGRQVDWAASLSVSDGVQTGTVDSTVILDPYYKVSGAQTCDIDPTTGTCAISHFWQLGGPGAPVFPDCSDSAGIPCNYTDALGGRYLVDAGITSQHVQVRDELLASMSALITTNGHYYIDLRWVASGDKSTVLVPDKTFNAAQLEARWGMYVRNDGTRYAAPVCYANNAPQRADPALVVNVPVCTRFLTSDMKVASYWQ